MIIEGHDVEKATEMVDAMQSSRVGAAYLALTVAPATEGKHAQIVHGSLNETVSFFIVPVPFKFPSDGNDFIVYSTEIMGKAGSV